MVALAAWLIRSGGPVVHVEVRAVASEIGIADRSTVYRLIGRMPGVRLGARGKHGTGVVEVHIDAPGALQDLASAESWVKVHGVWFRPVSGGW